MKIGIVTSIHLDEELTEDQILNLVTDIRQFARKRLTHGDSTFNVESQFVDERTHFYAVPFACSGPIWDGVFSSTYSGKGKWKENVVSYGTGDDSVVTGELDPSQSDEGEAVNQQIELFTSVRRPMAWSEMMGEIVDLCNSSFR